MLDPALAGRFTLGERDVQQDTRWWGGEPLWVTVEAQGQIAATMFWPGSDVEIAGRSAAYWRTFDDELPNAARVDQLLEWLKQPETAADLLDASTSAMSTAQATTSARSRRASRRRRTSIARRTAGAGHRAPGLTDA